MQMRIENETQEMRKAFCDELIKIADEDPQIVLLDADLMGAMGTKPFQQKYPEKTIDCGIQEANMVGVACGLSAVGKIPIAHTFAPFMTRRACDQIFVSGAYAQLNVKLIGSDPGITAQANGGTHMPFEDMGIMMNIPDVTVIEPVDITAMRQILNQMHKAYGVHYMRLVRKNCKKIYSDGTNVQIGKANMLKQGTDVTVIASGFCVSEALEAAEILEKENISVRVLDMFTWKPIDEAAINAAATETGAIVTCENHNRFTGLGGAVASVTARLQPVPIEFIGVDDRFGQVGDLSFLAKEYQLDKTSILSAIKKVLKRKEEAN